MNPSSTEKSANPTIPRPSTSEPYATENNANPVKKNTSFIIVENSWLKNCPLETIAERIAPASAPKTYANNSGAPCPIIINNPKPNAFPYSNVNNISPKNKPIIDAFQAIIYIAPAPYNKERIITNNNTRALFSNIKNEQANGSWNSGFLQ